MKLEVDITKKRFFALFGAILLLAGVGLVYAELHPGFVGHTADQIDFSVPTFGLIAVDQINWSQPIDQPIKIPQASWIEFGADVAGKQIDAGKIAYDIFHTSLNIVGSGSTGSDRQVKIWDDLTVQRNIQALGTITADGLDVPNLIVQNPAPPASNWICTADPEAGHPSAVSVTATCPAGYIAYSGKCEMLWQPDGGTGCASTIGPINGNAYNCYFYTCNRDSGSTCHSAGYRATAYCLKVQ